MMKLLFLCRMVLGLAVSLMSSFTLYGVKKSGLDESTRICPLLVAPPDCGLPLCCNIFPAQALGCDAGKNQVNELWGSLDVNPGPIALQGVIEERCDTCLVKKKDCQCNFDCKAERSQEKVGRVIEGVISFDPTRDALFIVFDDDSWRAAPASLSLSFVSSVRPTLSVFDAFGWQREECGYYNWLPIQYDADALLVHPKQIDCFKTCCAPLHTVFNYVNRYRACKNRMCGGRYRVGETTYPQVSRFFKDGVCFGDWADVNLCMSKPAPNIVGLRLYPCVDADFYDVDPCAYTLRKPTAGESEGACERVVRSCSSAYLKRSEEVCCNFSGVCGCCVDDKHQCAKSNILLDKDLCDRLKVEMGSQQKPLIVDPVTAVEIDQGVLYYQICSSNLADQCGGINPYKVDIMVGDLCIVNALCQLGCSQREICSIMRQVCGAHPSNNTSGECCIKVENPCLRSVVVKDEEELATSALVKRKKK